MEQNTRQKRAGRICAGRKGLGRILALTGTASLRPHGLCRQPPAFPLSLPRVLLRAAEPRKSAAGSTAPSSAATARKEQSARGDGGNEGCPGTPAQPRSPSARPRCYGAGGLVGKEARGRGAALTPRIGNSSRLGQKFNCLPLATPNPCSADRGTAARRFPGRRRQERAVRKLLF